MDLRKRFTLVCLVVTFQLLVIILYWRSNPSNISAKDIEGIVQLYINDRPLLCTPTTYADNSQTAVPLLCGEDVENVQEVRTILRTSQGTSGDMGDLLKRKGLTLVMETPEKFQRAVTMDWFSRDPYGYVKVIDGSQILKLHCAECAVVSNSGQLLGTNAGHEIDQANCVIRMNSAPTKGYENDVGSRTTVRISSFVNLQYEIFEEQGLFEKEKLPEKLLIWSGNTREIMSMAKGESRRLNKKYKDLDIYITTEDELIHLDRLFEKETGKKRDLSGSWLSTGFYSLAFAIKTCKHVKVYGMVESNHCNRITYRQDKPFHYYKDDLPPECMFVRKHEINLKEGHRFMTEKFIFKRWARFFNITFDYPQWNMDTVDERTPFMNRNSHGLSIAQRIAKTRLEAKV